MGLNEKEAVSTGIPYDLHRYDYSELDRAILDAVDVGFVKVLTSKGKDRILGATLVGEGAGERLIAVATVLARGDREVGS